MSKRFQYINIMNIFRLQLQNSTFQYARNKTIQKMQRRAEDTINIVNRNYIYKNTKKG